MKGRQRPHMEGSCRGRGLPNGGDARGQEHQSDDGPGKDWSPLAGKDLRFLQAGNNPGSECESNQWSRTNAPTPGNSQSLTL